MKFYHLVHYKIPAEAELWETEDDIWNNEKPIGIFSSEEKARVAIEEVVKKPGFRDWPGGFRILYSTLDEYETDGFITWEEALNALPPAEGEKG